VNAQDLITLRNGNKVECEITKVDSTTIYYNFNRGERTLSTFVKKSNIRSYQIGVNNDYTTGTNNSNTAKTVIIDTSKHVKKTQDWVNLISYSKRYGKLTKGWSLQYYGYVLKSNSELIIPLVTGFEGFELDKDYLSQLNYRSIKLGYVKLGISPFFKLSDCIFLNFGIGFLFGEEQLTTFYGKEKSSSFYGFAPSQGIYFISKSDAGFIIGVSAFEKLLTSEVYQKDIGIKFEIGLKF
jgi:hypothetical protein